MTVRDENAATTTMTKPVVTLFEMYGSGATEVGPKVAEALGVPWVSQAFTSEAIEEAAEQARAEADTGLLSRIFRALGGIPNPMQDDSRGQAMYAASDHDMVAENNRYVLDSTRDGGVILGRNATVILAARPNAVHVLLTGSVEGRVARAAAAAGITREQAVRRQVVEDDVRSEMSQRLYAWNPQDPSRYDLVINTSRIDLPTAVGIIVAASRRPPI